MAYFGVPEDRTFNNADGNLRAWPIPGEFQIFVSGLDGDERIGIQTGKVIELQLTDAKDCRIEVRAGSPVELMPMVAGAPHPTVAISDKYKFKLSARNPGRTSLSAVDATGKSRAKLDVIVGDFKRHPTMSIDLIAQVGQGADSLKIHALQRMLNNRWISDDEFTNKDNNIFEQKSYSNYGVKLNTNLTCGLVAVYRGEQVFGIPFLKRGDDWYKRPVHEPLSGNRLANRSDVKYRSPKITALIAQIVSALSAGQAVPVAVLDDPVGMTIYGGKLIAYDPGGHSVIIVGCNAAATQFLYIDPWGGGSWMEYKGGISGNEIPGKCAHLGLFDVIHNPTRRATPTDHAPIMIRGSSLTEASFNLTDGNFLEVVSARL